MKSKLMGELHKGYLDKLERERVCGVIERAGKLYYGYVSAKKVFRELEVEYHSNGFAHLYCNRWDLEGMSRLSAFKQSRFSFYEHYSGNLGLFIPMVPSDRCYIKINLKHPT